MGVLHYRPGLFGPSQLLFRNESALFPANREPEDYYREKLFPAKARVDLAYYQEASVFHDAVWLVRGVLVVFLPAMSGSRGIDVLAAAEEWIGRRRSSPDRERCYADLKMNAGGMGSGGPVFRPDDEAPDDVRAESGIAGTGVGPN